MKKTIRSFFTAALSLAALLITGSAWAVNRTLSGATVVWDHDFNTGSKVGTDGVTYTLAWNGNTVAEDGALVLNGDAYGSSITYEKNASMDGLTVIVKYSGLSALTDRTAGIAGITDSRDLVMVHSKANNSLSATAHWSGSPNEFSFNNDSTFGSDTGYVVISYRAGANSFIATGASLNALTGGTCTLKFGSTPPGGTILGGSLVQNGSFKVKSWPGVKIESVALFRENGSQSTAVADFANFVFAPTPVAQFIGDNMKDNGTSNGYVLSANGNTDNGNGSISLSSAHGGLLIDKDDFAMANGSVIVRYTAYTADTTKRHSFASFGSDSATPERVDDDYGCSLNGGDRKGCFTQPGTLNWYSGSAVPMNADGSTYAVVIAPNGNKLLYHDNGSGVMTAYVNSDKEKTSPTLNKLAIGGLRGSSASDKYGDYNTFNMTIDAIAVFDRALSEAEVRAYQFPQSQPIQPGTLIRWANTGSANEVTSGYVKARFKFRIPGSEVLPAGSTVKIKSVRLASISMTGSANVNKDPFWLHINGVMSGAVNGIANATVKDGKSPVLSADKKISANNSTEAYALEYEWTSDCIVTVGTEYGTAEESSSNVSDGLSLLHNNGNTLVGSGKSTANVQFVHSADANSIFWDPVGCANSTGGASPTPTAAGYYPVYEIIAEVIYNPVCVTKATVDTDVQQTWSWGALPWNVTPTKALNAEITVTGSKQLIISPGDDTDAVAKSITFKGESSVQFKTTGRYDGGKITSEIPLVLEAATAIDVDVGANDLTYSYIGAEISPNLTYTGNFTKGGAGTISLSHNVPSGKTLTVAGGTLKLAAGGQGIVGTLIIEKGATFVNLTGDGANYGGNPKIYVYGTLDMGNTRWTTSVNTFNFYPGSSLIGNGDGNAAIDVYGNQTYKFLKDSEDNGGTVTISGKFRLRNVFNVEVEDGMTAYFCCPFAQNGGLRTVNKSGAGVLKLSTDLSQGSNAFNINAGTLEVVTGAVVPSTTIAAGATLKATGSCASNFTVNGALVFDGGSLTGTISGTPTSVTVQGETEAIGYLAGATFDLAENATLVMSGAAEPLISGTINSVDENAKVKLPEGFAFGTIAKVGEGVTAVTVVNAAGETVTAAKVENGQLIVPNSEIKTEYDVEGTKDVTEDIAFGEGGSIVFKTDASTLNVTGTVTLPTGDVKLPISFTLKGEYAKDTAFTLITASNGIVKNGSPATLEGFNLPTVSMLSGMTGEFQLITDNDVVTGLKFVITSNTITAEAAAVLNAGHLIRRFDANRGVTVDANNKVTAWTDLADVAGVRTATPYTAGNVNQAPTYVQNSFRSYLDFGAAGSNTDLGFEYTANAKTVIQVIDIANDKRAFLMGCRQNNVYDFHRGQQNAGSVTYFNGDKSLTIRHNGDEATWNAVVPTGFGVISLASNNDSGKRTDCFAADRNGCGGDDREGGRKLCEVLIFDTTLSATDLTAVENYLTTKWALAYKNEAALVAGDNRWSTLNWGAGKSYVPGSPIEITVDTDNARLIYDDASVPVDSIVFKKNDESYNYTTAYGADFGAKTIAAGETMVIVGGADADHTLVYAGALTVNGTLKTEGYVDLSYGSGSSGNVVNSGATIEIVNGYTKAKFGDRGMKGTLTIDAAAKFASYGYVDAVNYSDTTTVNVYGTLDFTSIDNNQRWTLGNNNTMNFYTGSTIMGDGQSGANTGALQSNGDNCILNFNKAGDGNGVVNFSAKIHAQNAFTMNVEDGVTVNMSGSLGTGKNPFTLTGEGTINLTGTYDFNAPVTIGENATLIIDGGSCAGGYTNNGTIEVKNGNFNMGSKRDFAEVGDVTFGEHGTLSATATPAEYGAGAASFANLPAGLTTLKFIVNGVEQSLPVSEGKATYTGPVVIEGAACWYDFTFTNTLTTAAGSQNTATMTSGGVHYTTEGDAVYTYSRPYFSVGFTSEKFAVVLVGKMPTSTKVTALSIGSTVAAGVGSLHFATSDTADVIEINYADDTSVKPITTMTVPNSTTADHVYIVAKVAPRTFVVYLDGMKWKTINTDYDIVLAKSGVNTGLQFGSDYGGRLQRLAVDHEQHYGQANGEADGAFKVIRLYDHELSTKEVNKYSAVYPYNDPNGESTRTFAAATETWVGATETTPWHYSKGGDDPVEQDQQAAEPGAAVTIAINGGEEVENVEIGVNLAENTSYTGLKVQGSKPVKFAKGGNESGTIAVTGSVTFGVPTTIEYGALDIAGVPLTLAGDATVTFDYSTYSLAGTVRARNVELTGDVDQDDAKFTLIAPTDDIWKAELAYVSGGYVMQISSKRETPTTLYLTESATLSDETLYATEDGGEAVMPRLFADDVIYVMTGLTATMPSTALTIKPKFDGVGTIAVNGGTLKNSAPLFTLASTWTGTVEMTNIAMAGDSSNESWFSLNAYGNAASKVKLAGATGYMQHATKFLPEVMLENISTKAGIEITGGASSSTLQFRKVSGTGNLLNNPGSGVTQRMAVGDVSGFTGQVRALQTGGITLGSEENTAGNGQIAVADGATIAFNGQMWEAANGVSFGATLNVVGAAGSYITMPEPATLPEITVGGEATSLMLKHEEGKLMLAQAAASFNGVKYATLVDAITAANEATGDAATITVYTSWPEADALTINVAEGKTITLEGVNGACVCNESITKTGAGMLVINGPISYIEKSFGFAPTISAGTLVLKDGAIASGTFGKSLSLHTEGVKIASDAVLEFNVTEDFILMGGLGDSQIALGTVRKSGTGKMTVMYNAFATFEGTIDLVGGCIANFDIDMTINCVIKVSNDACFDATLEGTTKVILGANAKLDLSNISEDREDAIVKGNLKMAEGAAIAFTENQEALLCDGALTIGEEAITETTTVTGMSIFVDGQEYIADLVITVADGESGTKLYTVSYSNATPIIRITTEGIDASDLNAALDEAVEGTKVLFADGATLTLDEDVEGIDLLILGTANIEGDGMISAATIAAAGKTINLGEDVVFVPATPTELSTATITGAGTIVYDKALPGNEKSSYQNTANWTGTVWLKNITSNVGWVNINNFGHSGSKVAVTGFTSYFNVGVDYTPEFVLKDEGDVKAFVVGDGSSTGTTSFNKVSGSGTITTEGSIKTTAINLLFKEWSGYTGNITIDTNKSVTFGDAQISGDDNGKIVIAAGKTMTMAGQTWVAGNGIVVNGTIAGAGTLGSNTTFGNGATIDASAGMLQMAANKTLTFGNSLTIKLASAPVDGTPVLILKGTFTEEDTINTTLTVSVNDQPVEGKFLLKQTEDGIWAISNESVWIGAGEDHNWTNPANWQGGAVPTAGRDVVINVGEATDYSIVIDDNTAAINSLTITGAGVTFSGEGTINGPITFTTQKITGSLKAVGNVTVTSSGNVEVSGGMNITGNLSFGSNFDFLHFSEGTTINVSGDMRITEKSNAKVYFDDGEIVVMGTLYTGANNNSYTRYYFGNGNDKAMVITVNKLDANFSGRAFYNYDLASDATINVGEDGFIMQGRGDIPPLFNFVGGKYVATATSTFGGAANLQYVVSADSTIEVVDGATLTINNSSKVFGQAGKKITKTGAGTLKFAGEVLTAIDVTAGTVEMLPSETCLVTVGGGTLRLDLSAFTTLVDGKKLVKWTGDTVDGVTAVWPVAGSAALKLVTEEDEKWLAVSVAETKDVIEIREDPSKPATKVVVDESFITAIPGEGAETKVDKLMKKPEGAKFSYIEGYALGLTVIQVAQAKAAYIKAAPTQTEPGKTTFNFFFGVDDETEAIAPRTGVGKTVKYAIEYADSLDFSTGKGETAPATSNSVTVDLPQPDAGNSAVRYFKPKFSFE